MKRKLAGLILIAAAMGATASSWAFQSQQKQSVLAGSHVGGQKVARFTLKIRDTSNPFGVDQSSLTWTGVNAGDGWKIGDRLIVLNSTVTDSNGGIQIYTENTASDASPQFVDLTPADTTNPDSAAAGLLEGLSGSTNHVLPVAWSIKSSTKIVEGAVATTGIGATDPNNGSTTGANNKFQWLFVTDRYNTQGIDFNQDGNVTSPGDAAPFADGDPFISMVRVGGIHVQQNPASIESLSDGLNAYVYFEANFAQAAAQTDYQTTALRVEAFIQ